MDTERRRARMLHELSVVELECYMLQSCSSCGVSSPFKGLCLLQEISKVIHTYHPHDTARFNMEL
jgi:hypothetical protein